MTTRRLSRADVAREHTYEWLMQREDAETRWCPTCRATPGTTCINVRVGGPLVGQPAHMPRLFPTASAPLAIPPSTVPGPRHPPPPAAAALAA